jgi:protein O-GlcNAc transferase
VTHTLSEYEETAVSLAADRPRLAALTERLNANRLTMSLFDTERFARNLEQAYLRMYERYQADLNPDHIRIGG